MSTAKTIAYKKLQASGLIRAAAVAAFTRPCVRQLVVFKENIVEVWEVDKEKPIMIASTDLWVLVCNCEVLENPTTHAVSATSSLDRIVVTDDEGKVFVLEWSVLTVREVAINIIKVDDEKLEPLVRHSVISKPFVLAAETPLTSIMEASRSHEPGAKDWSGKIRGVTLVAMAIYKSLIQVILAAWIPITRYKEKNLEGSVSLRPIVNEYLLYMKEETGLVNLASQLHRIPTILDLCFIEELDFKGQPLLVILSAHDGLVYNLVNIQSYVLDLTNRQIANGPWKLSNLHPTTRLLLPWFGDNIKKSSHWLSERDYVQTGIKQGLGVIAISSTNLLFIESSGYHASLPITLDGAPTCCEPLRDSCLVVGDCSGALYVLDLKHWERHDLQPVKTYGPFPPAQILKQVKFVKEENGDIAGFVFFLSGCTSNSKLFALLPDLTGRDTKTPSLVSNDYESMSTVSDWPPLSEEGLSWYTKEYPINHSSLDDPISAHSMVMIDDPCRIAETQILVACGSSPTATLRRGTLGVTFCIDRICDDKIRGVPQVVPVRWTVESHYHTHLLLSYPTEGMTDITPLSDESDNVESVEGLEKSQTTLAIGVVRGDWLYQVTTRSLRVLSATTPRVLVAEWQPPVSKDCTSRSQVDGPTHHNIMHASVGPDGAVVTNGRTLFSVKLNKSGRVCTPGIHRGPYEVSALGKFEFWISEDSKIKPQKQVYAKNLTSPRTTSDNADPYFLVVIAQWSSNTVHLLTWPDLEEMTYVETGCCLVRSVCVTTIGKEQYLIVGTGEGNLMYYQIKYDIPKVAEKMDPNKAPDAPVPHPSTVRDDIHERENVSCLKFMQGLRTPVERCNASKQSLKKFGLRLLNCRVLKLGGCILSIIPGPFCGSELDSSKKLSRILEKQDSVFIQTDRDGIVLIPREDGELQAMCMSGSFARPVGTSFRIHTRSAPNSLALLSGDGQLVFGHVDLSVRLRWCKMELMGSPQQLIYHKGTGCVVITSNDGDSVRLSIVHVQSMCQVLTLELETEQHPTALEVVELPCVEMKNGQRSREYIIVACEKGIKEKARGILQFFDLNHAYTGDEELLYELRLLGKHLMELPCYAISLLRKQEELLSTFYCDICNIDSCIDNFEPLNTALNHLSFCNGHWNDYCRDQESKKGLHYKGRTLLALGYLGKVEIFAIQIGSNLASIILIPPLVQIIKSALPYLPDIKMKSDYDLLTQRPLNIDGEEEQGTEANKSFLRLESDIEHMTPKNSLVSLTRLSIFDSPGKSCVTTLIAISSATLLVGEMFQGIGIFSIQENGEAILLAWHPCSQPITTILQLENNLLVVALYEHGMQLMERDYQAEQTFQEEKKLWEEDDDTIDGTIFRRSELRRSVDSLSLADVDSRRIEMPCLSIIGTCSHPIAGMQMQSGRLGIQSTPIQTDAKIFMHGVYNERHFTIISPTGEVAEAEIIP